MSAFAKLAARAICAQSPEQKCALVRELADAVGVCERPARLVAASTLAAGSYPAIDLDYAPALALDFAAPSYAGFTQIVHPTRIRRAKQLSSPSALARTLHSVAHIEYSAIDLALDSAYRFAPAMGADYAREWVAVAAEEVEHFSALEAAMRELGCEYGDYPVHARLHEAAAATQGSARVRMGVVHRWLEACGLDANPFVARKILASQHAPQKLLAPIFERILRDEISHVSAGHRYYLAAGGRAGEPFAALLQEFAHLLGKIGELNTPAREAAGYEAGECELIRQRLANAAEATAAAGSKKAPQKPTSKEN